MKAKTKNKILEDVERSKEDAFFSLNNKRYKSLEYTKDYVTKTKLSLSKARDDQEIKLMKVEDKLQSASKEKRSELKAELNNHYTAVKIIEKSIDMYEPKTSYYRLRHNNSSSNQKLAKQYIKTENKFIGKTLHNRNIDFQTISALRKHSS